MIDDPLPSEWKDLQSGVCRLFNEIGLNASVEKSITTPRGSVKVDVYAVDENSVDKIKYIVECKNWAVTISQSVVHSFTTVIHETGANIGFIVSKMGLQPGAEQFTNSTNIIGLTYEQLQSRYFETWWQKYYCAAVSKAADSLSRYVEPFNSRRDNLLGQLSSKRQSKFFALKSKYMDFGILMDYETAGRLLPQFATKPPDCIEAYKNRLIELLDEDFRFHSSYFRELANEICEKLTLVTNEFNEIFGRDIFKDG